MSGVFAVAVGVEPGDREPPLRVAPAGARPSPRRGRSSRRPGSAAVRLQRRPPRPSPPRAAGTRRSRRGSSPAGPGRTSSPGRSGRRRRRGSRDRRHSASRAARAAAGPPAPSPSRRGAHRAARRPAPSGRRRRRFGHSQREHRSSGPECSAETRLQGTVAIVQTGANTPGRIVDRRHSGVLLPDGAFPRPAEFGRGRRRPVALPVPVSSPHRRSPRRHADATWTKPTRPIARIHRRTHLPENFPGTEAPRSTLYRGASPCPPRGSARVPPRLHSPGDRHRPPRARATLDGLDPAQVDGLLDMDPARSGRPPTRSSTSWPTTSNRSRATRSSRTSSRARSRRSFPASAPEDAEPLDAILADYRRLVEPNATAWQHPGFLAYFATTASGPGILGEMLTAAIGQNAMLWRTSPIGTELEGVVVGWLRQALGLPDGVRRAPDRHRVDELADRPRRRPRGGRRRRRGARDRRSAGRARGCGSTPRPRPTPRSRRRA